MFCQPLRSGMDAERLRRYFFLVLIMAVAVMIYPFTDFHILTPSSFAWYSSQRCPKSASISRFKFGGGS